jgi:hypothetical protein
MKLLDYIAQWSGALVMAVLGSGAVIAMFGPPMRGEITVDPPADEDQADEHDPGAKWDRAYDRAVDESNGVI